MPDDTIGRMRFLGTEDERASGVFNATSVFSICDTSLRASLGETPAQHRDRISELWARMSRIAADQFGG